MSTERDALIRGLRELADFLETHPTVSTPVAPVLNAFVHTKAQLADQARVTSWRKDYSGNFFSLSKTFAGGLGLDINIDRTEVCRQVVIGTRMVEAKPAIPEHVEEVTEWVCDDASLLASTA